MAFSALVALLVSLPVWGASPGLALSTADQLYRERRDPKKLRAAMEIWEAEPATSFAAAHKLARAWYFIGSHEPDRKQRMKAYQTGVEYAERAIALKPDGVEGHFWWGVLHGVYTRDRGVFKSVTMIKPIRAAFEKAIALDPTYFGGAPDRAFGRFLLEVPGFMGGDKELSLVHLNKALAYDDKNTLTLLYLGDTLSALGRRNDAKLAYQRVLDSPGDPEWPVEDLENKAAARRALEKLK